MRASKLLAVPSNIEGSETTLSFIPKKGRIRLIDTNLRAAIKPLSPECNMFSMVIKRGERGLVALTVTRPRKDWDETFPFIFEVSFGERDKEPKIDLNKIWIPSSERVGEIVYTNQGYFLQIMTADGKFFSNCDKPDRGATVMKPGLLCRFLLGLSPIDEVERAAIEHSVEESAREQLAKAKAKIEGNDREYWDAITAATEKYNKVAKENKLLQERIEARDLELSRLRPSHKAAVDLANALSKDWQWCLRTETVVALANFSRIIGIDFSRHK